MATISKKVFLAPSSFLAFIDRAHPKHTQAAAYLRYFAKENYTLFTDAFTVLETHQKIHEQISLSLSRDFLKALSLGNINIIYPQEADLKIALKTLLNHPSPDLTLEKAVMAVLASRRDISQVCTFDYLHNLFGLTTFYLPI